jgi:hypothetical protein
MPEEMPQSDMTNPDVAYEPKDVNLRGILIFGLALACIGLAAHFGVAWLFEMLRQDALARQPPMSPLVAKERPQLPQDLETISQPRLQKNETLDLQRLRQEEDSILGSYGWVDRDAGVVRLPIAEAMRMLANPKIAEAHGIRAKAKGDKDQKP